MAYEINVQGSKKRKTVLASKGLEGMGEVHFKIVNATGGRTVLVYLIIIILFFWGGGKVLIHHSFLTPPDE